MTGEFYFPEVNGSGAALFDYDNDGDLDAYLVQGAFLDDGMSPEDAIFPPNTALPRDRLFRNDLGADGVLRFTDVTDESGIEQTGYGMGVAGADYDNDGWVDLYVTNLGSNQLLRNNGDGTFSDVTDVAGVDDTRWSIPAVFFDYDGDGWLDLYCGNYVDFNQGTHQVCRSASGDSEHCGPATFSPEGDSLFRNRGDGTFQEVTASAGLGVAGSTMGAIATDLNGDGRADLYVANDGLPNQLWINAGDGTFRDEAVLAGVAVNAEGRAEASMGVAVADFDGDGDDDLFLTHLRGETNTLYQSSGQGFFDDAGIELGLATPSISGTGFGTAWLDYDLDGRLDILVTNGAVRPVAARLAEGSPYPLGQPNQLYRLTEAGTYEDVSPRAGASFQLFEVSRGAAFGDVDNDGDPDLLVINNSDPDLLVINNSGPARLLVNNGGQDRTWVGLRTRGADGLGDVLGARVGVEVGDGPIIWRRIDTSGSYASASDPRAVVGLGAGVTAPLRAHVQWPDGTTEHYPVEAGRYNELRKGAGEPTP